MKQLFLAYKKLLTPPYDTRDTLIIFIMALLLIGLPVTVSLSSKSTNYITQAAGSTSIEAEEGALSENSVVVEDPNASQGKYVKLGTKPRHFPIVTPQAAL